MNGYVLIALILFIICYCIYIIIYEERSVRSKLIEEGVAVSKYKEYISKQEVYEKHLEKLLKNGPTTYTLPKYTFKTSIKKYAYKEMDYYIINKHDNAQRIFYLHGGSYIEDITYFHWKFLDEIANNTNLEIIVPLYLKVPFYTYKESIPLVFDLYNKLNNNKMILMGDSAGGGFALTIALLLRNNKEVLPNKLILLSPWVDVTMSNKKIPFMEKKDPFLSKMCLIKAGILWSGQSDPNNWMISPINGQFNDLPPTYVFYGTREILLPDIKKLCDKLKHHKVETTYFEYKNLYHDFPLYPIPESKKVKEQIKKVIDE